MENQERQEYHEIKKYTGAKEAIENSRFVVHQVQEKKGRWNQSSETIIPYI